MAMESSRIEEGTSWKNLGFHGASNSHVECGRMSLSKGKMIRDDAAQEKQERTRGQWEQESPFKEILEQSRRNEDVGCNSELMRKGFYHNKGQQMGKIQRRNAE